jgi:hypothetical protein
MDEKKALNRSASIKIVGAIVLAVLARGMSIPLNNQGSPPLFLAGGILLLHVAAIVIFCLGCMDYAKSKGYSPLYRLFGMLGCIGLIVLAILPDKWKPAQGPVTSDTNYTRDPNRW